MAKTTKTPTTSINLNTLSFAELVQYHAMMKDIQNMAANPATIQATATAPVVKAAVPALSVVKKYVQSGKVTEIDAFTHRKKTYTMIDIDGLRMSTAKLSKIIANIADVQAVYSKVHKE